MALREARPFLLFLAIVTVVCLFLPFPYAWIALLPLLLFCYVLYFFRDPRRIPPEGEELIISAADGKVIFTDEVIEPSYTKQKMKRVAVFLSVFDVHINRMPYAGTIQQVTHQPGKFLDARVPDIDVQNEAMNWLIATKHGNMVVRQLAGLIARRIIGWAKEGQSLDTAERFGMIRFGSRTDVYLPLECEILVRPGDRVQGGKSVIARWSQQ